MSTPRTAINGTMLLASLALTACAWPLSFAWFFVWRFASGLAGGVLMVLAATTVLHHIPASRRGLASGFIFMGVGAGIAASGTVVPLLIRQGLATTWLGLGAISLALTAITWRSWPEGAEPGDRVVPAAVAVPGPGTALRALYAEYALNAIGLVPHMLFLVDFIARGLHHGVQVGAYYWVLFGLGALVGPVLTGHLADRVGFGRALRLGFLTEAVAVALPLLGQGTGTLMLSSVVVGAFTPGIVPLALGRIHELLPHQPAQQRVAWSRATTGFAVLQATAAYGMSYLFGRNGSYALLFTLGSLALMVALVVDGTRELRDRSKGLASSGAH
jgi:predicted MFS family arabinose efflux permease